MKLALRLRSTAAGALMITLWCVAILSITIVTVARMVDADVTTESSLARRFEARQLALTGIALGLNPRIERDDPLLNQRLADGSTLNVAITSENARLNINRLLTRRTDQTLARLFEFWEVPDRESRVIIDSLRDWTDEDELRSLNGAEREDLAGQDVYSLPLNRPFHSVEEMAKVRGMDVIDAGLPRWRENFSVYSTGRLDIQDVDPELARAIAGFTTVQADMLVELRNGSDGVPNTEDDFLIKDLAELVPRLGLSSAQGQLLQDVFSVGGEPSRIVSTADVGGSSYRIEVVINRGAEGERNYLSWEEE